MDKVKPGVRVKINSKKNIEVNPEVELLKNQYSDKAMQEELTKPENRRDIEARLLTEKTIARLKEYAASN